MIHHRQCFFFPFISKCEMFVAPDFDGSHSRFVSFSDEESLAVARAEKLRTRSPSLFWKGKISEEAEKNRKRSKNGKMPRKTCSQSFLQPNRQSMNEAKTERTHCKLNFYGLRIAESGNNFLRKSEKHYSEKLKKLR